MDGWLKGLVAAACIVIISGGSYFAWSEWQKAEQAKSAQQALEAEALKAVRMQAERLREAEQRAADERAQVEQRRRDAIPTLERNHCHQQLTSLRVASSQGSNLVDHYRDEVSRCIQAGYLTKAATGGLME